MSAGGVFITDRHHNGPVTEGLKLTSSLVDAVGDRTAKALSKAFEYETVHDLLLHLPRRYSHRGELTDLASLQEGEYVTVLARILKVETRPMRNRRGQLTEVVVTDGEANLSLTFFRRPFGVKIAKGAVGLFAGKVSSFRGKLQLTHPECSILNDAVDDVTAVDAYVNEIIPVYPATGALSSWAISKSIRVALDQVDWTSAPDPIPESVRNRHHLLGMEAAYRAVHRPNAESDQSAGEKRIRWEEALALQTVLAVRREIRRDQAAIPRAAKAAGLLAALDAKLPFELTNGQREIGEVIAGELAGEQPMHRLLQGEVGSGKTLVALRAMLKVVDAGGQAALLAPTEVLAAQHERSIRELLGPLADQGMFSTSEQATTVTLVTGSQSTTARRQALLDVASGQAGIVIGTHALLEDKVTFADLGLVVVDEQHRFGVEQRAVLTAKAVDGTRPHVLVMTATPIPRTVAITVFGDLDISVLRELPAGRAPITTHVVPAMEKPGYLARTWERVREEVDHGRQAYVVCPRITGTGSAAADLDGLASTFTSEVDDAPTAVAMTSVYDVVAMLADGPLKGLRIETLHGKMPADEKDSVMRRFTAPGSHGHDDRIDVLVATTVIEVGVDVPNATVMVVMDADRFGVSQLHQLRGRVGRGGLPGLCLLVTNTPPDAEARERLDAVAATTDGFELSEVDLRTRREGDVLGADQSGRTNSLRVLSLLRDTDIIVAAKDEADQIVRSDPALSAHPALATMAASLTDPDAAEWLDRS